MYMRMCSLYDSAPGIFGYPGIFMRTGTSGKTGTRRGKREKHSRPGCQCSSSLSESPKDHGSQSQEGIKDG